MKKDTFIRVFLILIFLALVANVVTYTSERQQALAQEEEVRLAPGYEVAVSLDKIAEAIRELSASVESSNDNIARSIETLALAVEKSKQSPPPETLK